MKNKTVIILLLTIIWCFFLVVPSSWAGSKQRHRWEGVAIGIGAAVIGSALVHHYACPSPERVYVYRYAPPPRNWSHYRHGKPHYWPHYIHEKPRHHSQRRVKPQNPHYYRDR